MSIQIESVLKPVFSTGFCLCIKQPVLGVIQLSVSSILTILLS